MVGIKGRSGKRKGSTLIGGESVHVRLPPGLMRKVEAKAAEEGITVSEWIRRRILTFVITTDTGTQSELMRAMEPFLTIVGEALEQTLKKDRELPKRMETALSRAIKDQLQELANQGVIPTKESKRKKEAQY
jgi:hypothetical protein